ncbi:Uncharacterised protein [uncultured archaeon]|nr:Uncharacterised protein [uncultured archaeon]
MCGFVKKIMKIIGLLAILSIIKKMHHHHSRDEKH